MNEQLNTVNIEELQKSLETITSMEQCINNVNPFSYFTEIETDIRQINFEHANCISNYRNIINTINDKIEELKRNLLQLQDALTTTIHNFSSNELNNNNHSTLTTSITQIPKANSNEPEIISSEPIESQEPVNTIPIGLGIGAAGIAGSVGSIILNSRNSEKNSQIEEYHPTEEESNVVSSNEKAAEIDHIFDDDSPYHATRDSGVMDKFYGSNITEYYEKEDEDEKSDY